MMKSTFYHGRLLFVLACLAGLSVAAPAATLQVGDDSLSDFKTIQEAVEAALDGDIIVVNPGTYTGAGNCDIDLLGKEVTITGADPLDPNIVETTLIDCAGAAKEPHRGFYVADCNGAAISGLTITNGLAQAGGAIFCLNSTLSLTHCRILGNATLDGDENIDVNGGPGGGLYCEGSQVEVVDCLIANNAAGDGAGSADRQGGAGGGGGGIYSVDSTLWVLDSAITDNTAGDGGQGTPNGQGGRGGGLYADMAVVERSVIMGNMAGNGTDSDMGLKDTGGNGGDGGGIYCDFLEVANTLVAGNQSGKGGAAELLGSGVHGNGGGISCYEGFVTLCTIVDNVVHESDSDVKSSSAPSIGLGAGIFCTSRTMVTNSILWNNASDQIAGHECEGLFYCDIADEVCVAAQGNLSVDPSFVRAGAWVHIDDANVAVAPTDPNALWVAGDYHLRADSPCIDMGDPNHVAGLDETDLDGNTRVADGAVDIGAYEFQSLVPVYRFWSQKTSKHFYTTSESEKDKLVDLYSAAWSFEGIAYYAFARPIEPNLAPVYRFWSEVASSHFYTISEAERDKLIDEYAEVWTFEGEAFYAYPEGRQPAGAKPVHRFWSDKTSAHFYTISESETNKLIDEYSEVWTHEGVAWYAYEEPTAEEPGKPEPPKPPEPPIVEEPVAYDFMGGPDEASLVLELKAYLDGKEAVIDPIELILVPAAGQMGMVVDLASMTVILTECHVESEPLEQEATIGVNGSGGTGISVALSFSAFFDTTTPRGAYEIDPQSLSFPAGPEDLLAGGDETFTIVGSVTVDGKKLDVEQVAGATNVGTEGSGVLDTAALPDHLDIRTMPFRWSREKQEDLLLDTTVKGQPLQLYVTSAVVQTGGLWRGTPVSSTETPEGEKK
jgi:hypothetical protein